MNNKQYYTFFKNQPRNIITSIDGDRGKGKTILMVYFLSKNPELPKIVNFNLKMPKVEPLEVDKLLDLNYPERVMIGITESTTLLEKQTTTTYLNRYLGYVGMQSRKIGEKGVDILIDEQVLETIQSRFLTQCDMFFTALGMGEKGFYYSGYIRDNRRLTKPKIKCVPFKTLFDLKDVYDTKEKIEPMNIENLKVSVMSQSKRKEIINQLAKEILDNREKYGIKNRVSMPQVNYILSDLDKPENLSYYLHPKLNIMLEQENNIISKEKVNIIPKEKEKKKKRKTREW